MSVPQDQTIEVSAESQIAAMVNEEQRNDAQTPVANAESSQARTKDVGTKHRRIRELHYKYASVPSADRCRCATAAVGCSMLRSARRETCGGGLALTPSRMDARGSSGLLQKKLDGEISDL